MCACCDLTVALQDKDTHSAALWTGSYLEYFSFWVHDTSALIFVCVATKGISFGIHFPLRTRIVVFTLQSLGCHSSGLWRQGPETLGGMALPGLEVIAFPPVVIQELLV